MCPAEIKCSQAATVAGANRLCFAARAIDLGADVKCDWSASSLTAKSIGLWRNDSKDECMSAARYTKYQEHIDMRR